MSHAYRQVVLNLTDLVLIKVLHFDQQIWS